MSLTYTDSLVPPLSSDMGVESVEAVTVTYTDGPVPPGL